MDHDRIVSVRHISLYPGSRNGPRSVCEGVQCLKQGHHWPFSVLAIQLTSLSPDHVVERLLCLYYTTLFAASYNH